MVLEPSWGFLQWKTRFSKNPKIRPSDPRFGGFFRTNGPENASWVSFGPKSTTGPDFTTIWDPGSWKFSQDLCHRLLKLHDTKRRPLKLQQKRIFGILKPLLHVQITVSKPHVITGHIVLAGRCENCRLIIPRTRGVNKWPGPKTLKMQWGCVVLTPHGYGVADTEVGLRVVPRFCEFGSCQCLPLLPQVAWEILATWGPLFNNAVWSNDLLDDIINRQSLHPLPGRGETAPPAGGRSERKGGDRERWMRGRLVSDRHLQLYVWSFMRKVACFRILRQDNVCKWACKLSHPLGSAAMLLDLVLFKGRHISRKKEQKWGFYQSKKNNFITIFNKFSNILKVEKIFFRLYRFVRYRMN